MKLKLLSLTLLSALSISAQVKIKGYIPNDATIIVKYNQNQILNNLELEKLENYTFIKDMMLELSDEKTDKLSDLGVDFTGNIIQSVTLNSKFNKISFSITLNDVDAFFKNTFLREEILTELKSTGIHESSSKVICFKENVLTVVYFNIDYSAPRNYTDSVFRANEWDRDNVSYYGDFEWEVTEEVVEATTEMEDEVAIPPVPPAPPAVEEEIIVEEEMEVEMEATEKIEEVKPTHPNYNDYVDSVRRAWKAECSQSIITEINEGNVLNAELQEFMLAENDVNYYYANNMVFDKNTIRQIARNFELPKEFVEAMLSLSVGTSIHTSLNFTESGYEVNADVHYNEFFKDIYAEIEYGKFDKSLLNYIPSSSNAYTAVNLNTFESYENLKERYIAKFEASDNIEENSIALAWYTLDHFLDVEALYEAYPTMFVLSYNGFIEQEVTYVDYVYDEDFNAERKKVKHIEKVPSFSLALSSEDTELAQKTFTYIEKHFSEYIERVDDYYIINLNQGPKFYVKIKGDKILASNDINFVTKYADGYGSESISKQEKKALKKTAGMYLKSDFALIAKNIPAEYLGEDAYNQLIEFIPYFGTLELSQDLSNDVPRGTMKYTKASFSPNGLISGCNLLEKFYTEIIER